MHTMSETKKPQNKTRNKPTKSGRKPRREYKQVFGPGMMVSHETYGLGTVTSAFKWHICVLFHMLGTTQTVQARELSFTREEQVRRRKIQGAIRHGMPVACAAEHLGKEVVSELMGFGVLVGVFGEGGLETVGGKDLGELEGFAAEDEAEHRGKVLVCFKNEYTKAGGEVLDPKLLRIVVPREKPVDDKKRRRR